MFEVEKPRRFHYEPRFYDPEKEKWEALKKKYADEHKEQTLQPESAVDNDTALAYFEKRVREINQEQRQRSSQLSWKDLFRKREMPKFSYQPRFSGQETNAVDNGVDTTESTNDIASKYSTYQPSKHQIKIHRRFDISDSDYMKPISGTKIMTYVLIVCFLLALIFF